MRKKISLLLTLNLAFIHSAAFGADNEPEHTGCSYSLNEPCPALLNSVGGANAISGIEDKEGHATQYCKAMKANDIACDSTLPMGAGYTAVAATCGLVCFGGPFTAVATPACQIGTFALSMADMISGIALKGEIEKYNQNATATIAQDWGFIPSLANAVGQIGLSAYSVVSALNASSAGSQLGKGGIHGKELKNAIQKTETAQKANNAAQKIAACISFGTNTLMASLKFGNYFAIKSNSADQYRNLCSLSANGCHKLKPLTPLANNTTAPKVAGSSVSGSSAPGALSDPGNGTAMGTEQKINEQAKSGKLASSFMQAAPLGERGLQPSGEGVQKAMEFLNNNLGITPGALAKSVEQNGVSNTLGSILKSDAANDMLKKIDDQAKKIGSLSPPTFASAGGAQNARTPSSGGGFGVFGAGNTTLTSAGATSVKFNGFQGDIWHAGTNKSIFEIVSDKTKNITSSW